MKVEFDWMIPRLKWLFSDRAIWLAVWKASWAEWNSQLSRRNLRRISATWADQTFVNSLWLEPWLGFLIDLRTKNELKNTNGESQANRLSWRQFRILYRFVAMKIAVCSCQNLRLKHVLHECDEPVGCPLAWSSPSLRGWRTSWCLRTGRRDKLQTPPAKLRLPKIGIEDRSWSPERSRERDVGRGAFGWEARWSSGTFWSHEERLFLVCIGEASSLHRLQGHSCEQLSWRVACVEPFHQWICERFAWYVPWWCLLFGCRRRTNAFWIWRFVSSICRFWLTAQILELWLAHESRIWLVYALCSIPLARQAGSTQGRKRYHK